MFVDRAEESGAAEPFESLEELKSRSDALLSLYAEDRFGRRIVEDAARFVARAQATGTVLALDSDRWAVQVLVDYWANVLFRLGHPIEDTSLAPLLPERTPELPDDKCPYRGLKPFVEADRTFFFGRQALLDDALHLLRENRWLTLIGDSGTGKSSFLRAMLLPTVKEQATAAAPVRCIGPLFPGVDPVDALASALGEAGVSRDTLLEDPSALRQVLSRSGTPAVLAVDQFEEVFTLCSDLRLRDAFIAMLVDAATAEDGPRHAVVITMRSDFQDYVLRSEALARIVQKSSLRLRALTAAELRDVIERPAALAGLHFDSGIVDELVTDAVGEPAALPLLQFVLLRLWQTRQRNVVTRDAFRKVGRWREALTRAARELYESMAPEEQTVVRWLLLRLVKSGEGLEFYSRRQTRTALVMGLPEQRVEHVLGKLIAAGIVRESEAQARNDKQFEIAHESLIRNWTTLSGWLDEERWTMRRRAMLTDSARTWDSTGRDASTLLRGKALDEIANAEQELTQASGPLTELESAYLNASRRQKRRVRHWRRVILAGAVAVVAFFVFALERKADEAKRNGEQAAWNYRDAFSALLAEKASRAQDTDLALLLAIESDGMAPTGEPRAAVLAALQRQPYLLRFIDTGGRRPYFLNFTAPHKVAALAADGTFVRYDIDAATGAGEAPLVDIGAFTAADFAQGGGAFAAAASDGRVRVWDTAGKELSSASVDSPLDVALSPNGRILAILTSSKMIRRDVQTGAMTSLPGFFEPGSGNMGEVAVSNDGLVAANSGSRVWLWNAAGKRVVNLPAISRRSTIPRIRLSADGRYAAAINVSGQLTVWDVRPSKPVQVPIDDYRGTSPARPPGQERGRSLEPAGPDTSTTSCGFSADSSLLITGHEDGSVRVYVRMPATFLGPTRELRGHLSPVYSVAIASDTRTIASVDTQGRLITWDIKRPFAVGTQLVKGPVFAAAASADGKTIAAIMPEAVVGRGSAYDTRFAVRTWSTRASGDAGDLADPREWRSDSASAVQSYPAVLLRPGIFAVSGDASVFAWVSADNRLQIRTVVPDGKLRQIDAGLANDAISSIAMSPDGLRLAAVPRGKPPVLIDLRTKQQTTLSGIDVPRPTGRNLEWNPQTAALAFSADGRRIAWSAGDRIGISDTTTGKLEKVLECPHHNQDQQADSGDPADTVRALAFSGNGTRLVAAMTELSVWDTAAWNMVASIGVDGSPGDSLALDQNGDWIASTQRDGAIEVWRRTPRTPTMPELYRPAGRFIGAGDSPGDALAFTPAGDRLLATLDGQLQSLELRPDVWRSIACRTAGRNLSPREWLDYMRNERRRPTCGEFRTTTSTRAWWETKNAQLRASR